MTMNFSNSLMNIKTPIFYFLSVFGHLGKNEFSQFRKLIEVAEMGEEIDEEFAPSDDENEPLLSSELITLFVPSNEAFNKLTSEQKEILLGSGNIFLLHIVSGYIFVYLLVKFTIMKNVYARCR